MGADHIECADEGGHANGEEDEPELKSSCWDLFVRRFSAYISSNNGGCRRCEGCRFQLLVLRVDMRERHEGVGL
jgi:hypothetical protein